MENSQHYPSSFNFPATGSSQQKTDVAQYMNNNYLFDQKFRNQVSGVTDFKINTPLGGNAFGATSSFEHYSTRTEEPEAEEEEEEENKEEEEEVEEGVVDPVFASATPLGSAQWENFPEVLSGMQFAPMSGGVFGGGGFGGGGFGGGGFGGGGFGGGGAMNALGGPIGGAPATMGNPRVQGTFNPFQSQFNKNDLPEFLQSMLEDTPEYLR